MHKILFHNQFIICLYVFRALLCSSSGGQNCIIQHLVSSHPVGGRPILSIILVIDQLNTQNSCFTISLLYASTCFEHCCAHHQEVKIVLYSIWYRHTYRWPSGANSSINLCTGRPPTGVILPDAV